MKYNGKGVLSVLLLFVFFVAEVCRSQSITTCANNTLINIEANETENYIYSYGYPNNYAYTNFGDCRILITTTMDGINITIVEYNKRTNESTLNFFSGVTPYHTRLATEESITEGRSFVADVTNVYITHWSYGDQNNAFIISYMAFDNDKEEGKNEEEGNFAWVAGPVVGFVVVVCFLHMKKKKDQENAKAKANQVTEMQVTEVTPQQNTTPTPEQTSESASQQNGNQNNTNSRAEKSISGATTTQGTSTTDLHTVSLEQLPKEPDEPALPYPLVPTAPPSRLRGPETLPTSDSSPLPGQTELEPFPVIRSPPPPYSMVSDSTVLPDTYPLYKDY